MGKGPKIQASGAKYIKLGVKGNLEARCSAKGA